MGATEPGRGIIRKTTGVVVAVDAGALLERLMAREIPCSQNWEGNVTESGDEGDPLIAKERGEALFFLSYMIVLHARGRKQGQCHPRLGGRHLHGSW